MKQKLLLWMTALVVTVGLQAQRSYTFNVAAYNVDGLPETVNFLGINITTNAGAGGVSGATDMGEALQTENWEIVGLSEDFNYHEALVAPLTNYYHVATHGGEVGVESMLRSETDGLGLLVANKGIYPQFSGETRIAWSSYNGQTDNGADGMITKGFRYYAVTLDEGIIVDVYVLHMDAGSTADDIAVREEQLGELRDYIISHDNGRHTFVIGDWNCRYTRENMKTLFIDKINEVENMTIRDAWVECIWGGEYPKYGANAMMVTDATYGNQKGEVVDKILWIENSKSPLTIKCNMYERDETFPVTDHNPVLGNFTITNPTGEAINDWSVEGGDVSALIGVEGDMPQAATVYYLKNVSTGLYLKPGGSWGTQLTEGNGGAPVTLENLTSDGTCILRTCANNYSIGGDDINVPFWDNTLERIWTLEQVPGTQYQYYLKNADGKVMSSTGESGNPVTCSALTGADTQKWAFMSEAKMKEEMLKANENGFNITPLIQSAEFDAGNQRDWGYYTNWTNFSGTWNTWLGYGGSASDYKTLAYIQSTAAASTISQTLSNMPAGRYELSFDGLYRYEYYKKATSKPAAQDAGDLTVPITFGSQSTNLKKCTSVSVGDHAAAYNEFATTTTYNYTLSNTLTETGNLALSVAKPATTQQEWSKSTSIFGYMSGGSEGYNSWVVIDNFKLMFYPSSISEESQREAELNELAAYINQAWDEVQAMGPEAVAAYDLSTLVYRYENGLISDDIEQEKAIVDEAVAVSKLAANQAVVDDALASDGDITSLIVNPSFEDGVNGWTIGWGAASMPNTDVNIATDGTDGSYLLNVYIADNNYVNAAAVNQILTCLPNGLYELKAQLTSFGPGEGDLASDATGNTVYIVGNGYHKGIVAETKTKFKEATVNFLVVDGTAKIGVVGGYNGIYYYPTSGCFYKADNFRLKYICDPAHGRVKLALDEAKAITLDQYGQNALDLSAYETAFENRTITGDGTTEAKAIYDALQTASKTQKTVNADMTYAITNPNFETGDYTGWACSTGGDTQAAPQDNTTYAVAGSDGRFLFNTWSDGNIAQPLTQTVTGLANGTYTLTAMVASDSGNNIQLTANGESTTVAAASAKSLAVFPSVTCEVTDGTLDIEVVGENNVWYKADDFRLTYLGRELTLNETDTSISYEDGWYTSVVLNRNVKANTWNTFVVPFNMEIPSGWTVKELSSATQVGDVISMTFSDASSIEAGTPYMVKTSSVWSGTTIENTDVTSVLNDVDGSGIVTFKGNYISGNVPTDAFFISGNKFYQAINENNTLKAFRGYFEATGAAGVNVLNFTFDDEVTGIDTTVAEPTAEVIAIYSLDGRRIESLQRGVNIVKLSNGKTKKLIVK